MASKRGAQQKICDDFTKKYLTEDKRAKNGKLKLPRKQWVKLLAQMYDPSLPAEEVCFFTQEPNGIPKGRVETKIGDETFFCTVAFKNELPAAAWKDVEEPPGFLGPRWPPETVADLLGCSTLADTCIECTFGDSKIVDGEQYLSWSAKMYNFWLDNILLYKVSDEVGYGLKAWKDIPKHSCIGEYTGEVVPHDEVSNKKTQYQYDIDIGPVGANGVQTQCWLDGTHRGSIFRFMNHSCRPNASVEHGRCGMHNRILYVYTLKAIKKGEDITISYGTKWFAKKGDPCLCGLRKCKNPPGKKKKGKREDRSDENKTNGKSSTDTDDEEEEHVKFETKKEKEKNTTKKAKNDSEDERKSGTNLHSTPAQIGQEDNQSTEESKPVQPTRRRRLQQVRRASHAAFSPRRSPRLSQNASNSSSPTRRRSPRLSPDPPNRITKQPPRRGPVSGVVR